MIPVTVHGAEGRMGRLVTALVAETPGLELVALVTEPGRAAPPGEFHPDLPLTPQDRLAAVHPPGGVLVDFSLAGALPGLLSGAAATAAPLVVGTTGYTPEQQAALAAFAREHAVVQAANFSIGIPVLTELLRHLAALLPPAFTAEQVETHHRHKQDRPSGTARALAAVWREARGEATPPPAHSVRLGGITGVHHWIVADDEEVLELRHTALSRRAFLRGLVPAIRFVATAPPGLYGMKDVLASEAGNVPGTAPAGPPGTAGTTNGSP